MPDARARRRARACAASCSRASCWVCAVCSSSIQGGEPAQPFFGPLRRRGSCCLSRPGRHRGRPPRRRHERHRLDRRPARRLLPRRAFWTRRRQGEAHRRVAQDDVAAGVVVGRPQPGQLQVVRDFAELDVLQLRAQRRGQRGVALVEELHRRADGVPLRQAPEGVLERPPLRPRLPPAEGVAPGALHVPHHGQGPPARVPQEALREAGDEGMGGDLRPLLDALRVRRGLVGEVVQAGGARPVAGEVEGDQPQQPGLFRDVLRGEVELRGQRLAPFLRPGPVLAQQGPLVGALAGVAGGEAHPVAGREQQGRGGRAPQQGPQAGLRRPRPQRRLHRPPRVALPEGLRQGGHQLGGAEAGGAVVGVLGPEERRPRRQGEAGASRPRRPRRPAAPRRRRCGRSGRTPRGWRSAGAPRRTARPAGTGRPRGSPPAPPPAAGSRAPAAGPGGRGLSRGGPGSASSTPPGGSRPGRRTRGRSARRWPRPGPCGGPAAPPGPPARRGRRRGRRPPPTPPRPGPWGRSLPRGPGWPASTTGASTAAL